MEIGWWPFSPSRLRDLPLKVNGDDCVFATTSSIREAWKDITASAGLEPSVGKCYSSKRWLQINSQCFTIDHSGVIRRVKYFNFGLMTPWMTRGGQIRSALDLGPLAEEVLATTPGEPDDLMSLFLRRHRQSLRTIPAGMSYWLPTTVGGLGLPITREVDVSFRQRELAEYLLQSTLKERRKETKESIVWDNLPKFTGREIPSYLRRCLVNLSRFRVLKRKDPSNEEEDDTVKDPYSQLPPDFRSAVWQYNYELDKRPDDGCGGIGVVAALSKRFERVWRRSKISSLGAGPLEAYLLPEVKKIEWEIPGGLDRALLTVSACPKNLFSKISAKLSSANRLDASANDSLDRLEYAVASIVDYNE
jgi:hypothetical protein